MLRRLAALAAFVLASAASAGVSAQPQNGSAPSDDTPPRVELALGPKTTLVGLPAIALGGALQMGCRWRRFALHYEFGAVATLRDSGVPERRFGADQWAAALFPCVRSGIIDICVPIGVSKTAFNFDEPSTLKHPDGVNVSSGFRVAARWHFADRFALLGFLDAIMDFRRLALWNTRADGLTYIEWQALPMHVNLGIALAMSLTR